MRKCRSTAIKKMIRDFDAGVLTSIAEVYGSRSKDMNPHQLYKAAKNIWKNHLSRTEIWGKYSLKPPEVPITKNEAEQNEGVGSGVSVSV